MRGTGATLARLTATAALLLTTCAAVLAPGALAAPTNTVPPSVAGAARDGQRLKAERGAWGGQRPISYSYSWSRCDAAGSECEAIAGAFHRTYEAGHGDVGHTLRVTVTAADGEAASATSAPSEPVAPAALTKRKRPKLSGSSLDGQVLSVGTGSWKGSPPQSYSYQWQACPKTGPCSDIAGATGPSYRATTAEIGEKLRAVITAENAVGSASAASTASKRIAAGPPVETSLPVVAGTPQEGQTLSASSGEWAGTGPISFSYQWLRCSVLGGGCQAIVGAVGPTYTAGVEDLASNLAVVVTAANAQGSATATSLETEPILGILPTSTILPSISGLLKLGKELSASTGSWSGTTPMTFGYQWQLCNPLGGGCANIAKATSSTLLLGALDVGGTLRVVVTATNAAGSTPATSAATGLIEGLL